MENLFHKKVLLVGATPGMATIGLLYLTSYLKRNGIEAFCQLENNYMSDDAFKKNLLRLLKEYQPTLVGISMKWFQHIARGLRICELVKSYSPSIKVVTGGNTASYFQNDIIRNENVDYIIRGDGELPLLMLSQGKENIPNLVYKEDNQVKETDFGYVHNQDNSEEIFISNLDEIIVDKDELSSFPFLYINTGKGCNQDCFYCGGSRQVQMDTFNREQPYYRSIKSVRKDIFECIKYTDILMFDFEIIGADPYNIYGQSFSGIDLKEKSGTFYSWVWPTEKLIELLSVTFKEVQVLIDISSLSERQRFKLQEKGLVKKQPTDEQLFQILRTCEKFGNVYTGFTCILGMPFVEPDELDAGEEWLDNIIENFPAFSTLEFSRLHAQPGAPMLSAHENFGMNIPALSFHDYYKTSKMNWEQEVYPGMDQMKYPQITYKDNELNQAIMMHSMNIFMTMQLHNAGNKNKFVL